jgi:hypothetical protein
MLRVFAHVLLIMVLSLGLIPPMGSADEASPVKDGLKEAIATLEARKSKATSKADQEVFAEAITQLQKLLAKQSEGPKPNDAAGITPALVAKKFAGKAAYNATNGELTLIYDLRDKAQLKDFDVLNSKPRIANGVLSLEAGESIRHVVEFKTLTVTCQIANKRPIGVHLATTEKISFECHPNFNTDATWLKFPGGNAMQNGYPRGTGGSWSCELKILPNRLQVKVGDLTLGKAAETPKAGQIQLYGGESGNQFARLVLTGQVEEAWAKRFFAE